MYSQFQHPGQHWLRLHNTEPERTSACAVNVWEERDQDVTSRVRTCRWEEQKHLKRHTAYVYKTLPMK